VSQKVLGLRLSFQNLDFLFFNSYFFKFENFFGFVKHFWDSHSTDHHNLHHVRKIEMVLSVVLYFMQKEFKITVAKNL
jgi:hypothetical protein